MLIPLEPGHAFWDKVIQMAEDMGGDAVITAENLWMNQTPTSVTSGATITVPGSTVSLTETNARGVFAISPTSANVAAAGESGTIAVSVTDTAWTVLPSDVWIT